MKKPIMVLSSGLMAVSLLAGCGAGDNGNGNNDAALRNVGYYSDQTDPDMSRNDDVYRNNAAQRRFDLDNPMNNNNNDNNANRQNVDFRYDNEVSRRIASQVNGLAGVKDANVLMTGDTVVIGVTPTNDEANDQKLEEQIRSVAKSVARDKHVRVVTDTDIVNRITDVNNRMDNGNTGTDEIQNDVQGILNDLGDAVKRPFQNNAR